MIRPTRPGRPAEEAGVYADRTLDTYLTRAAAAAGRRIAVVEGDVRLTYSELDRRVAACAAGFARLGVRRGDVVTVLLPNWWEGIVAIQAALRLGAVVNPVIAIYRAAELAFILRQCRPRLAVVPHLFRKFDYVAMMRGLAADLPEPPAIVVARAQGVLPAGFHGFAELDGDAVATAAAAPDDVSLLLYTSGTTADPKGVLHTHQTLDYEVRSIVELCGLGRDDAVFMPSPITHITGYLFGVLMPALLGAKSVLLDIWDAERGIALIEAETCRFTMAATPFLTGLTKLYEKRGARSAMRHFLCGGADVPPVLIRRARDAMGTEVARIYGSSEFPTFSSGVPGGDPAISADTDGLPIGPVQARIDGPSGGIGELLVRGPDLFVGYLDPALNEAAFTEDGFFRTGDLARIEESGAVTICGRAKDIINRGGEKISAKQVEDALHRHAAVGEVAVVGMPDAALGEKVCAFVVPKPGFTPTLADLVRWLEASGLARQKFPERLELLDALPMTASGKIQKFKLREQLARSLQAAGQAR